MKKITSLIVIVLMVASVAFAAAQKKMIGEKDLPGLEGTWEGMLDLGMRSGLENCPAVLTIENDTVPVKMKLTVRNIDPSKASLLGMLTTETFEADNGVITTEGTLRWTNPAMGQGSSFEVSKGRRDKILNVSYSIRGGTNGTGTFYKK
ncbi:MAG TPA: hypothetical protein VMV04_10980 [Thermodesulfobacteriota bacterium]|nr:hypothetical protein [Thermodesulfobacteriota bacterium]